MSHHYGTPEEFDEMSDYDTKRVEFCQSSISPDMQIEADENGRHPRYTAPPAPEVKLYMSKDAEDDLAELTGSIERLGKALRDASAIIGAVSGQMPSGVLQDMLESVVDDIDEAEKDK